jgi:ribonuclease VapC
MVIDTSALFAILTGEPAQRRFVEALEAAEARLLSAATLVETAIIIESRYGLNYGDCFAYALARVTGEALLFKGDDFAHTDVRSVE